MSTITNHPYFIGILVMGLACCLTKCATIRHHKRHVSTPMLEIPPPQPPQPPQQQHPVSSINDNLYAKPIAIRFQPNFYQQQQQLPLLPPQESIRRNSYDMPDQSMGKSNVFFGDEFAKTNSHGATFGNVPAPFIGPNYALGSNGMNSAMPMTDNERISSDGGYQPMMNPFLMGLSNGVQHQQPSKSEDTINDMFTATLKKYNVKKYLLDKILGSSHEADEDEGGFFSNKHLKRHGNAGIAGKVIGELIGIKIRETIESFGKSFSEYAKDFTSKNVVNIGQAFSRMIKF